MKMNANAIRVGNVIEHQNRLWRVLKKQHTMPGKGGAFVQLELKSLDGDTKLNERFRSSEDVKKAHLDQKDFQYLFESGDMLTFMDTETYEQIEINKDVVGDAVVFLQDGTIVSLEFYENTIVGIDLPESVVLEVVEAEPVVKGQTAASSDKPAILDNGIRVMVPPFIAVGDKIVVKTADSSYVERAK